MCKRMKRTLTSLACAALALLLPLLSLTSCATEIQAKELSADYERTAAENGTVGDTMTVALSDFSFSLFCKAMGQAEPDENQLLSPLSAMLCLAMLANGADGNTRAQMEAVLGMSIDELNPQLYALARNLYSGKDCKLTMDNSVWFRDEADRLTVEPDFLQANADWYGAEVYATPFDEQTVKDINAWCSKATDGMIDQMIESIPRDTVMYLINALLFDAKWQETYEEHDVRDGTFTNQDGTETEVKMLYSEENAYLSGSGLTGFARSYKGGQYAFVGLLPEEGQDVGEAAATLTGEAWRTLWREKQTTSVQVGIPEFKTEYKLRLNDCLTALGMEDLFDSKKADLTRLGHSIYGNLYCSEVVQKTYLEIDRNGTRAAAITWAAVNDESIGVPGYSVYLDRPFIYLIVDVNTGIPVFVGVVRTL